MELLKYIHEGFEYIPMIQRISYLESQMDYLNSRVCVLDSMHNDWNKQNHIDRAVDTLTEIIQTISPEMDYYKINTLKDSLRNALK